MWERLKQWNRGQGFAAIRTDWLKRAAGLGEALQVRLPEREISGRFQGLDDAGRLLLEQAGRSDSRSPQAKSLALVDADHARATRLGVCAAGRGR